MKKCLRELLEYLLEEYSVVLQEEALIKEKRERLERLIETFDKEIGNGS